jgi:hypothetical protein
MKACWAVALLIAAAIAVTSGGPLHAQRPPDLTGVWTDYVDPRQPAAPAGSQAALAPGLPFTGEAQRKVDAYRKLVAATGDSPGGYCLGAGMPTIILGGATYPMEIVQRPEQITIIFELHTDVRHIYFGARNTPEADRVPFRNGYSSGRWEGDTLVVETSKLSSRSISAIRTAPRLASWNAIASRRGPKANACSSSTSK